ncbi:cytochrome c5 family protein [Marinomonas sp. FW-1]|uniref:c-type cytochrome n=1 Tax=Marinomonas sp. FW-1 TaxID=2071621 RepID=UPI0010C10114|nr:c-type cytochrome [Marinomonas sp. FW-1]
MNFSPTTLTKPLVALAVISFALGLSSFANAARSGETLYNRFCIACHMNGVAGAPKMGHAEDWQPRIEKGIDTLLKDATSGYKAMPPKGLCFDCSEDELRDAIQYMIDKSSSK